MLWCCDAVNCRGTVCHPKMSVLHKAYFRLVNIKKCRYGRNSENQVEIALCKRFTFVRESPSLYWAKGDELSSRKSSVLKDNSHDWLPHLQHYHLSSAEEGISYKVVASALLVMFFSFPGCLMYAGRIQVVKLFSPLQNLGCQLYKTTMPLDLFRRTNTYHCVTVACSIQYSN